MPKVSVILPVYNNETTIVAAIRSILNQTYTDFELIVVNDGSMDHSAGKIASVSDHRIVLTGDHLNLGLPKRLNKAISQAKGEYIARMDADDLALPDRLEKQVAFLDRNLDIDLVGGRTIVFNDKKKISGFLPFGKIHAELTRHVWNNIPLPHPTWMMRKSWVEKFQYAVPEVWRAEDQDLLLRAHKTSRYACLDDIVLCYRQGKLSFGKTALARRHLLAAQVRYFYREKNYTHLALSIFVFTVKTAMDVIRIRRKPEPVSADIEARLADLLDTA